MKSWSVWGVSCLLAVASGCGSGGFSTGETAESATALCAALCPAYLACADGAAAPAEVSTPMFCGVEPAREAECQTLCAATLAQLGDSEADFVACASCVGPQAGDQICDADATNDLGAVACRDHCSSLAVANASDLFYPAFAGDMRAADAQSCHSGAITVAAADPRFTHDGGSAQSDGSWACDAGGCGGYPFAEGPAITLPPGTYDIRLDGLVVASTFVEVIRFEVRADDELLYDAQFSADQLAAGAPTATVTLSKIANVVPLVKLYSATSARLASVTFVRR